MPVVVERARVDEAAAAPTGEVAAEPPGCEAEIARLYYVAGCAADVNPVGGGGSFWLQQDVLAGRPLFNVF